MRYIAAYLLAVLGGNSSPDVNSIEQILGSVGVKANREAVQKLIDEMKGRDIADILSIGNQKIAESVTPKTSDGYDDGQQTVVQTNQTAVNTTSGTPEVVAVTSTDDTDDFGSLFD